MTPSAHSLILIGGGITGLTLGLRALDLGFSVKLVAKDAVTETTSALSAGMIAPAMEALTEADPAVAYGRYQQAQKHWPIFAEGIGLSAVLELAQPAVWLWSTDAGPSEDEMMKRFTDMGARGQIMRESDLAALGYEAPFAAIEIVGEWLVAADAVLAYLKTLFIERGGQWIDAEVVALSAHRVDLSDASYLDGGQVVVCAGFGSKAFATAVPSLAALKPIKGHLLDRAQKTDPALAGRMIRSPWGYFVFFDALAKFGASMQTGLSDEAVEPSVVSGLKDKAAKFTPKTVGALSDEVQPRVGVRAATPDGWPMIGLDAQSGVYVATGMRRNGWIYAPFAADVIMALISGQAPPEGAEVYNPQRFTPH